MVIALIDFSCSEKRFSEIIHKAANDLKQGVEVVDLERINCRNYDD